MGPEDQCWAALSSAEKLEFRWARLLQPDVEFVSAEAEAEYAARVTRLREAILLEATPDRVPVSVLGHFYPALRSGMTPYEAMYDYKRAAEAWLDCNRDLQPDAQIGGTGTAIPGRALDILDMKTFSWPGHGVPKETGFQYNEQEWMGENEYDLLIDDPTDYLLHVYLPRVAGGMGGFAGLVSPLDMAEISTAAPYLMRWTLPGVRETFDNLVAAGCECNEWATAHVSVSAQLVTEGLPAPIGAVCLAPFDFIGDTLRGTRGVICDMFRQPDALVEACSRLARLLVKWVTRRSTPQTAPLVIIPLHKGADGFMSDEQFKTFYWPSLRGMLMGLVEDGFVPYLFAEGAYGSRLEVIRDLPPARTLWHFDRTDMRTAKKTLGGVACIQGNVPLSLLQLGSPGEVTAYAVDLIEAVGPGGGFVLDVGAALDDAKDGNVAAMVQAAKKHGLY